MAKLLLPMFLVLTVCAVASAQDTPVSDCPEIKISGPAGIVLPGDSADFRAEISPSSDEPLTMVWTVSAGVIEKGQGESTLTVRTNKTMDGKLLYAQVDIFGLPAKCPNTARDSAAVSGTLHPIIIDEYGQLPANDEYARLDVTIHEISSNDGSVAVIVLNVGQEESEGSVRSRVERIEGHIFALRKFERGKVRFAFRRGLSSTTTIYRVPSSEADDIVNFYAESASPELLFSSPCPTFTVNGPNGLVAPGDPIVYTATIDGELPKSAKLVWSVNKGEIIEGWGTERIVIAVDKNTLFSSTIMATLEIQGLPDGCPDSASETLPPIDFPEPILIDEFSDVPVTEIARDRLADSIREAVNNPTNQLYIIEYFPRWTSEFAVREKISRMREYMADDLKFDLSRVTIVTAEGTALNTKIYRIPPGTGNPTP